jgi:pyruvate dehydrogenase E2 component (dihydrolipoamide acetyltransferase)
MPTIAVRIPQIGEGLQEARLVAVLKNPGDNVKRDEPIYQMETDKAVMDVESPYEGVLVEWLASVDTVLPIGGEVARMEVGDGVREMEVHGAPTAAAPAEAASAVNSNPAAARNANIPPRTRAYAKEKGISDSVLSTIPSLTGKLMPDDIDAYLSGGTKPVAKPTESAGGPFSEDALNQKQRVLSARLVRGSQLVVPGTITVVTYWAPIENLRAKFKGEGGEFQPSAFTLFAFAVARALREHAIFRSTLRGEETLRTYESASLGIAVARPGDELVLAVVEEADIISFKEFADRSRIRINEARDGKDQANEAVTISLTNMQAFGLRDAVPVVVPPSVATIFLGEAFNALDDASNEVKLRKVVNLVMTFDHRLMNGVGAANFLNAVKENVEGIESLVSKA